MADFHKNCIYQIYPKSFQDTDGDGFGDIRGIISRLDYLKKLGIDYIWCTPFFVSPQYDNGYDIADYRNIDPAYGTMEDFEELIKKAGERGISLMLDMVFNHTSTEHEWFKKAMAGDEYYKDFYIFRDEKTNWESKFGGEAWEYVPEFNQYYLHLYDKTQADLNWENPNVRNELKEIIRFWIDKGVKGFRFDVINLISKPEIFKNDLEGDGRRFYTDGPRIHEYLKELSAGSGLNDDGIVTVGEMSSTTLEHCICYSNPDEKELSMCFNFHHLKVDYKNQNKWELQDCDFGALKSLLHYWQVGMQKGNGWNAVFWCNHDQPRIISRFGDEGKYYLESAKMLAAMVHFLRGTPFIYQGEEIGMTNAHFTDIKQYRDVESLNYFEILKYRGADDEHVYKILAARSRDNSRTPMQWDSGKNAGFTKGTPWIETNHNHVKINVEQNLNDPDSIFAFYQKLIRLRKEYDIIGYGSYEPLLTEHPDVFAYERKYRDQSLIVINNFFGRETTVNIPFESLDGYQCLLSNYQPREIASAMVLQPYETVAFLKQ